MNLGLGKPTATATTMLFWNSKPTIHGIPSTQLLLYLVGIIHSNQGSNWIIGTSLTLSTTKQGTALGTLVVLFYSNFTCYIWLKILNSDI